MRILHLSDLHLTGENDSFESVWHGPVDALGERLFDAVVISGDLAQAATREEYALLETFLQRRGPELFAGRGEKPDGVADRSWRRRVILVPGNHDVDWTATLGRYKDEGDVTRSPGAFKQWLKLYAFPEEDSRAPRQRAVVREHGVAETLLVDGRIYPHRFANVHNFFEEFYREALGPHDHQMKLLGREEEQWSAHVFPEFNVAFYGFNSCLHNDRHWHGATLSAKAIAVAADHANATETKLQKEAGEGAPKRSLLRIAVWHHGLTSTPGRPDAITLKDLGALVHHRFRVGLHGHTHRADAQRLLDFGGRFVLVSTGSLGAASPERPDAVGNQVSVVQVNPGQVEVELYEHEGEARNFRSRWRRHFVLTSRPEHDEDEAPIQSHQRHYRVDEDGILSARVTLEGAERGDLPPRLSNTVLALVTPPFCDTDHDGQTDADTGFTVVRQDLPDGRRHFALQGVFSLPGRLTWAYRASNAIALNLGDLGGVNPSIPWRTQLDDDEECQGHVVRFPTERLEVKVTFAHKPDGGDVIVPGSARVIVERRTERMGRERWERMKDEVPRCKCGNDACSAWFDVDSPIVGYRYTIAFKLARPGVARHELASEAERSILGACLDNHDRADHLARRLSETVVRSIEAWLEAPITRRTAIVGMVWLQDRHQLFTAFGRFRHPVWAVRFAHGDGVAGHAFRFNRPAAWRRAEAQSGRAQRSLIFLRTTDVYGPKEHEYRWVLCIPIAVPGRMPIGVLSFAAEAEPDGEPDLKLEGYVDAVLKPMEKDRASVEMLGRVVSAAFWTVIEQATREIPQRTRDLARDALARLTVEGTGTPIPPAGSPSAPAAPPATPPLASTSPESTASPPATTAILPVALASLAPESAEGTG